MSLLFLWNNLLYNIDIQRIRRNDPLCAELFRFGSRLINPTQTCNRFLYCTLNYVLPMHNFFLLTSSSWNDNPYFCVCCDVFFLSSFIFLRKNAKQHQDKHQICIQFNASLQPVTSSCPYFLIQPLSHFTNSPTAVSNTCCNCTRDFHGNDPTSMKLLLCSLCSCFTDILAVK